MTQINVMASGISNFVKHVLNLIYACSRTSHEFYSEIIMQALVPSAACCCCPRSTLHQIEFYILEIPIITAFNLLQNDIGLKSSNGDHDIILRFRAIKLKNTLIKMHTIKKLKGYE